MKNPLVLAVALLMTISLLCQPLLAAKEGRGSTVEVPGASSPVAAEPGRPIQRKPRLRSEKVALEVLAGLAGNALFGGFSASLFVKIFPDGSESFVPASAVVGYSTGSFFGSALGVYLVGNSGRAKGKFAAALLGSFLGEIAALGFTLLSRWNAGVYILSTAILPVAGATILFNRSLRVISFPAGNGLLNLEGDKLKLGIPAMQVRALPFHAKNMKPELRFDVRLLSIAL